MGAPMEPEMIAVVADLQSSLELVNGETVTTKLTVKGVLTMTHNGKMMLKVSRPNRLQARCLINTIFEVIADRLKAGAA